MAKRKKNSSKNEMRNQVKGILIVALAFFCYVGLTQAGQTGGLGLFINNILRILAGETAVVVPIFIGLLGLRFILPGEKFNLKSRMLGLLILSILVMIWIHLQLMTDRMPQLAANNIFFESIKIGLDKEGGGFVGAVFAAGLFFSIGLTGSRILLAALALISALLVLNISVRSLFSLLLLFLEQIIYLIKNLGQFLINMTRKVINGFQVKLRTAGEKKKNAAVLKTSNQVNNIPGDGIPKIEDWSEAQEKETGLRSFDYQGERAPIIVDPENKKEQSLELPVVTGKSSFLSDYLLPTPDLLTLPGPNGDQQLKNSRERAKKLESTLQNFGVKAKVTHVQSGPTVTRFEVQPEAGVKVSKIISLSDDLALNLAAPLVRIEAPIPGKAALGIEVPNTIISLVHLREVIEEKAFKSSSSPLTIGLGKDITGVPVIADLANMPHLLIAGATGAGKSVCLNSLITSILFKANPEQLRFMMIDPKVVELSVYNGIPHLLMPVLTDPRKASLALRKMVKEMGRRYELFASLGVRDIRTYSEMAAGNPEMEHLPYIVIIIDELADLMHVSPGEVEDAIARLAQMSRAAGIHLIVATQRPSVDVLTGIIKANITSRIAFTVSSQFDSRTILDMAGAEKLLGRGDMLFYPVGAVKPFRVQGAYISEDEVKKITDFIKEQGLTEQENGTTFLETPEEEVEEEEIDTLFTEAADLVVRTGQASISLLQRRFRIGYTRAARLIDDLERKGIVGEFEGSKPRQILVTAEQAARICEEINRDSE